jgi:hypothetical protein
LTAPAARSEAVARDEVFTALAHIRGLAAMRTGGTGIFRRSIKLSRSLPEAGYLAHKLQEYLALDIVFAGSREDLSLFERAAYGRRPVVEPRIDEAIGVADLPKDVHIYNWPGVARKR